jgi:hypothetical protein
MESQRPTVRHEVPMEISIQGITIRAGFPEKCAVRAKDRIVRRQAK